MGLPEVLANLRKHPGMYLNVVSYDAAVAFVNGYDAAMGGGLLVAFREWLVVRFGEGNNLTWFALVRGLMQRAGVAGPGEANDERAAIEFMFATLDTFLLERDERGGMRRIYRLYEEWLRKQDWYTPSSPDWIQPT